MAVWFGRKTKQGKRGQDKSRALGAYAVSGSISLPGSLLRQQVFDRVLHSDALVHSLGIFWTEQNP